MIAHDNVMNLLKRQTEQSAITSLKKFFLKRMNKNRINKKYKTFTRELVFMPLPITRRWGDLCLYVTAIFKTRLKPRQSEK